MLPGLVGLVLQLVLLVVVLVVVVLLLPLLWPRLLLRLQADALVPLPLHAHLQALQVDDGEGNRA